MNHICATYPSLFKRTKNGTVASWNARVGIEENGIAFIEITHGLVGGKMQIDRVEVTEGKNLGKINASDAVSQAESEALSRWKKKVDREHYAEDVDVAPAQSFAPMLAQKYMERKHKVVWPAYIQPKLNGVRAIATPAMDGSNKFLSRRGIEFTGLQHISEELVKVFGEDHAPLDGELFNPALNLQEITSRVRRSKEAHPLVNDIEYHIYDVMFPEQPFRSRTTYLHSVYERSLQTEHIKIVKTLMVDDESEMMIWNRTFLKEGYEGIMVRNADGLYEIGFRSQNLLKYKQFEEEEFTITEVKAEETGREAGLALFICQTKTGGSFTVRPKGSFEQRAAWYQDRANIVGKELTVRFLSWSTDKIPQHPVGLVIRDYE